MTEMSYWHKFVCLYQMRELELSEIAQAWLMNTLLGVMGDDVGDVMDYDVLDGTRLHEMLVAGLLSHESPKRLLQSDMADMLLCHTRTIREALKRLEEKGHVRKEGVYYRLIDVPFIPMWIIQFTKAMIDLRFDDELLVIVREASAKINFKRGIRAVRDQLREKFYRPRTRADE
jgi:hypothetical protein